VQSVALRLIVDREREIEAFRPQEYWSVAAQMAHDGTDFTAKLVTFEGEKLDRLSLGDEGTAMRARAAVENGAFKVEGVETKPHRRNPQPPFTTSTLQQEAARKLGFSASQAMRVAQSLYEAGAITYMRTDGVQSGSRATMSLKNRATTKPRRRTRRKPTRRSGRPTSPRTATARATRRASTT
jgi:DNA topoisomerase I